MHRGKDVGRSGVALVPLEVILMGFTVQQYVGELFRGGDAYLADGLDGDDDDAQEAHFQGVGHVRSTALILRHPFIHRVPPQLPETNGMDGSCLRGPKPRRDAFIDVSARACL